MCLPWATASMVSAPWLGLVMVMEVSTGNDSSDGPGVSSSASTWSSSSGRTESCSASRSEIEKMRRILPPAKQTCKQLNGPTRW